MRSIASKIYLWRWTLFSSAINLRAWQTGSWNGIIDGTRASTSREGLSRILGVKTRSRGSVPDQTYPCKRHWLHLHAQDVISPVDQLGPFDHARKPWELLLPVLHAAQITDLRRTGLRRNSRPTSASGFQGDKASPRSPRCAWRACRPARLQLPPRPGARRPRAASCPHRAGPRRRRSVGRPDGHCVSTRTARPQGHAA